MDKLEKIRIKKIDLIRISKKNIRKNNSKLLNPFIP